MDYQQLAKLINGLDLPARHIKSLGEDLMALRCGLSPDWISYVINLLAGGIVGKYGAATPLYGATVP